MRRAAVLPVDGRITKPPYGFAASRHATSPELWLAVMMTLRGDYNRATDCQF